LEETEDTEFNITFGLQRKQGSWEAVPGSLSFQ